MLSRRHSFQYTASKKNTTLIRYAKWRATLNRSHASNIAHICTHLQQHCCVVLMRECPRQFRVPPETKRTHRMERIIHTTEHSRKKQTGHSSHYGIDRHNEGMGGFLYSRAETLVHVQTPCVTTTEATLRRTHFYLPSPLYPPSSLPPLCPLSPLLPMLRVTVRYIQRVMPPRIHSEHSAGQSVL